jgi:hypothetical protein
MVPITFIYVIPVVGKALPQQIQIREYIFVPVPCPLDEIINAPGFLRSPQDDAG